MILGMEMEPLTLIKPQQPMQVNNLGSKLMQGKPSKRRPSKLQLNDNHSVRMSLN